MAAEITTIKVVGKDGRNVPNAVVEIAGKPVAKPQAASSVMAQRELQFIPSVIAVAKTSSVEFPNFDDTLHHVYSFSAAKKFDLKLYGGNEAPSVQFDEPGIVAVGCNIHDQMRGYIYVSEAPTFAVTNHDGEVVFEDELTDRFGDISIWHPLADQSITPELIVKSSVIEARISLDDPRFERLDPYESADY
ncbi:MAG: methylamine utilization protein [Pseudomonadota bacterium]